MSNKDHDGVFRLASTKNGLSTLINYMSMRKLISSVFIAVVTVSVSGCLSSKKPLLPASGFKAATPVKPGHYIKLTSIVPAGKSRALLAGVKGVVITQRDKTYAVQEADFTSNPYKAQLFGSKLSPDYLVAQIALENGYLYRKVMTFNNGSGFSMLKQECRDIPKTKRAEMHEKGIMSTKCNFANIAALDKVLQSNELWLNSKVEVFRLVAAKDVIKVKDLQPGPLINPFCGPDVLAKEAGTDSAAHPASAGAYMKILRSSTSPKGDVALAIESSRNTTGKWAWISGWKKGIERINCRPDSLIKVLALQPETSLVKEKQRNKPLIEKVCKQRNYVAGCAPISEAIAAYESEGYKIILQGLEYVLFSDLTVAPTGGLITVMGQEGSTSGFIALFTGNAGETTILRVVR